MDLPERYCWRYLVRETGLCLKISRYFRYTSRYRNQPNDNVYNMQIEGETIIYAWVLDTKGDSIELSRVTATAKASLNEFGEEFVRKLHTTKFHIPKKNKLAD